jgi:hypothetical protein
MKKMILTATLALSVVGLFAQTASAPAAGGTLMDKKGEMYLPEAGDWAVAFDAGSFLTYIGDFFGKSSTNYSPALNFNNNNYTIVGKYYVDAQTAYRGVLRIGFNSNSYTHLTPQDQPAPGNPPFPTVNDQLSVSSHFIGLGAGIEKRKGKTRLQGYYGAELMFWLAGAGDSSFTYGNSYGTSTTAGTSSTPHYYNFSNGTVQSYALNAGGRPITDDPGSTFGISIQAFVGVEYFIVPKISIGAEYTWGINFWSQGQGSYTLEQIYTPNGGGANVDANVAYHTGGTSHFGVDTGVNPVFGNNTAGGALSLGETDINVIFHF